MIKIKANSISHNLVQVKPLGPISSIKLYYADYKYEDLLEVRKKKIEQFQKGLEIMDNDDFHIIFPIVTKVYAKTLGSELISVEPGTM